MGKIIGKIGMSPVDSKRHSHQTLACEIKKVFLRFNHRHASGKMPGIVPRLIAILTIGIIVIGAVICFAIDLINKYIDKNQALGLLESVALFC